MRINYELLALGVELPVVKLLPKKAAVVSSPVTGGKARTRSHANGLLHHPALTRIAPIEVRSSGRHSDSKVSPPRPNRPKRFNKLRPGRRHDARLVGSADLSQGLKVDFAYSE